MNLTYYQVQALLRVIARTAANLVESPRTITDLVIDDGATPRTSGARTAAVVAEIYGYSESGWEGDPASYIQGHLEGALGVTRQHLIGTLCDALAASGPLGAGQFLSDREG